jgi:hypothetical protein
METARNKLVAPLNHRPPERYERFCRALEQRARGEHRGGRLANLFEQAIQCNDGDHAAKSSSTRSGLRVMTWPTTSSPWPHDREQRARIIGEWLQTEARFLA